MGAAFHEEAKDILDLPEALVKFEKSIRDLRLVFGRIANRLTKRDTGFVGWP